MYALWRKSIFAREVGNVLAGDVALTDDFVVFWAYQYQKLIRPCLQPKIHDFLLIQIKSDVVNHMTGQTLFVSVIADFPQPCERVTRNLVGSRVEIFNV